MSTMYRIERRYQAGPWEFVSSGHDRDAVEEKITGHRAGAHPHVKYRRVRDKILHMVLF